MICKIKFHSESMVVAPVGSFDDQVNSSGQQKWSTQQMRSELRVLEERGDLLASIFRGPLFIGEACSGLMVIATPSIGGLLRAAWSSVWRGRYHQVDSDSHTGGS